MSKARAKKEGNIRLRADGRYEVRVTVDYDPISGKQKRVSKYATTQEEAVRILNQMSYIYDTAPNQFTRITLPLLTPSIFYVVIVAMINGFQLFPQVMIMTGGGPNGATQVMVERIYQYGFRYYRMGYAAAFSWILFVIIMVFTAIQMKGQERWVHYDS